MITEEEKQEIINLAVEKALLKLPEVVGNLMANQAMMAKINKKFYAENPELVNHKQLVGEVIEKVESDSPGKSYEEIIRAATPIIKSRLGNMKGLNLDPISKPSRNVSNLLTNNGEL